MAGPDLCNPGELWDTTATPWAPSNTVSLVSSASSTVYTEGCPYYYGLPQILLEGEFRVRNDVELMISMIDFEVWAGYRGERGQRYTRTFCISIFEITRLLGNFKEFMENVLDRLKKEVENEVKKDNEELWKQWQDRPDKDIWVVWNRLDMTQVNELIEIRNPEEMERKRAERRQLELERIEIEKKRVREELKLQETARKRAEQLLKEIVSEVDFTTYKEKGYIEVLAKSGKKYRIKNDKFQSNVEVFEREKKEWKYQHRLCAHLQDTHIPIEDNVVAQVLMLRHDEGRFLQMANIQLQ